MEGCSQLGVLRGDDPVAGRCEELLGRHMMGLDIHDISSGTSRPRSERVGGEQLFLLADLPLPGFYSPSGQLRKAQEASGRRAGRVREESQETREEPRKKPKKADPLRAQKAPGEPRRGSFGTPKGEGSAHRATHWCDRVPNG